MTDCQNKDIFTACQSHYVICNTAAKLSRQNFVSAYSDCSYTAADHKIIEYSFKYSNPNIKKNNALHTLAMFQNRTSKYLNISLHTLPHTDTTLITLAHIHSMKLLKAAALNIDI